jgi:hypothetical protein
LKVGSGERPGFGTTKSLSQRGEAAEVAGRGEDGVGGITTGKPEIVAAYTMLDFEMADDGLDGGPAA